MDEFTVVCLPCQGCVASALRGSLGECVRRLEPKFGIIVVAKQDLLRCAVVTLLESVVCFGAGSLELTALLSLSPNDFSSGGIYPQGGRTAGRQDGRRFARS